MALSRTAVDKLGERFRDGSAVSSDLDLLAEYRTSFAPAFERAVDLVRQAGFDPSVRRTKTMESIVAKLRRQPTALSRMQDIAGLRIVVDSIASQDSAVGGLTEIFPGTKRKDRRKDPSHGYRAVHLMPQLDGKVVEIQIRTELQHRWAQLCEVLADRYGIEVKYGGGPADVGRLLEAVSWRVVGAENLEVEAMTRSSRKLVEYAVGARISALALLDAMLIRMRTKP